jgi:DNA-directed RNA polymerase subunit omega
MLKPSPFNSRQINRRSEDLIKAASNRYRITVQVATRAQRRRFEDFDSFEENKMKPVLRAIIEMSDELTQPEIIGE